MTFAQCVALADEHQAGLPYRHIVVEHEPSGQALEASFRAEGWKVDREVLMALQRPPDGAPVLTELTLLTEDQGLARFPAPPTR